MNNDKNFSKKCFALGLNNPHIVFIKNQGNYYLVFDNYFKEYRVLEKTEYEYLCLHIGKSKSTKQYKRALSTYEKIVA